ncbi:MAG: DUF4332 domain-containing protein [Methanospirillum sp.]|nr:DUF4332 domain-containing protein [Methanospirillum sp.]
MRVIDIEGIGPAHEAALAKVGITTVEGLLESGATRKGRKEIAAAGISDTLVLRWVNIADLYRIKGIGRQYSELVEASGVDTVVELANRVPENLWKTMQDVNEAKNLVRKLPTVAQIGSWIAQAKELPRVVTY